MVDPPASQAAEPEPSQPPPVTQEPSMVPELSPEAISASSGRDPPEAGRLAKSLHEGRNEVRAVVVSMDIRDSTTLMLHLEDFHGYANAIASLMTFVKQAAIEKGGWFDKFTGDGALCFWLMEAGREEAAIINALEFARDVQLNFLRVFVDKFRMSAGCVPSTFGMAIGVDGGKCVLSDLRPHSPFTHVHISPDGTPVPITIGTEPVMRAITVLGRPVVGATRMASVADAHQILVNEHLGVRLFAARASLPGGLQVDRVPARPNKDIPGKGYQFVYEATYPPLDQTIRERITPYWPETSKSG